MSFGKRRSSPLTGEIKSVRRDERGQERCMVEFIGFSNAREFKALGKWFSHRTGLKLELVKHMKQEGEKKRYDRRQSLLFWTSKFGQSTPVLSGYRYGSIRYGQVTDVRLLRPPHPAQCQPGTRCQA